MPTPAAERDIERAEGLRKLAKRAQSASAKSAFNRAADRLEDRGARSANKLGKRHRTGSSKGSKILP